MMCPLLICTIWYALLASVLITMVQPSHGGYDNLCPVDLKGQHAAEQQSGCDGLSRALLERHAVDGTVLVTVTDWRTFEVFGCSFIMNVQRSGIRNWLIAAADPHTSATLHNAGVSNCFNAPNKASTSAVPYEWLSSNWAETTWHKVRVVQQVQSLGFHVIHSDIDVVWMRDPLPYFLERHPVPAVLVSTDRLETDNQPGDDGVEKGLWYSTANTGVYFVRDNPAGRFLMEAWLALSGAGGSDQDGFNRLVLAKALNNSLSDPAPVFRDGLKDRFWALNNTVPISYLPAFVFSNSYSYMQAQDHLLMRAQPYEVHYVWGYNGNEGKAMRMRETFTYHDPPSYYDPPHIMTMDLEVPLSPPDFTSWRAYQTADMMEFHLQAVQQQLQQLYWGFAIAWALNRTLVLPKVACFCSRNWFYQERCRIGFMANYTLPYTCSASELLRLSALGQATVRGRGFPIREHTFLENPLTSSIFKESVVVVHAAAPERQPENSTAAEATDAAAGGPGGASSPPDSGRRVLTDSQHTTGAHQSTPPPGDPARTAANSNLPSSGAAMSGAAKEVQLPAALGEAELAHALRAYQGVRRLHFPSPHASFGAWEHDSLRRRFDQVMQQVADEFCCRDEKWARERKEPVTVQLHMAPRRVERSPVFYQEYGGLFGKPLPPSEPGSSD